MVVGQAWAIDKIIDDYNLKEAKENDVLKNPEKEEVGTEDKVVRKEHKGGSGHEEKESHGGPVYNELSFTGMGYWERECENRQDWR